MANVASRLAALFIAHAASVALASPAGAVANAFFGWGLMLRLDDAAGVTLAPSTR